MGDVWANVSGSLLLGFVLACIDARFPTSRLLRPFLGMGFFGSYTTYSTFAVETDLLVKDGYAATALTYVGASVLVGLIAVALGMRAARRPSRPE